MRRMLFSAVGAAAAFSLAACSGGGTSSAAFDGTWVAATPTAGQAPKLVLGSDGGVSGSDGCNSLVGKWTATGSKAQFPELAATKMFCPGVDDWLGQAATATIDGDTLTVYAADGDELGALQRTS